MIIEITYPAKCKDCKFCKYVKIGNLWRHKCVYPIETPISIMEVGRMNAPLVRLRDIACKNIKL